MKTIGKTSSGKPIYAAFQFHRNFDHWTANDHADAAQVHRDAVKTDIKTNRSMHETSAALHDEEMQRIHRLVEKLGLGRRQHATKKQKTGNIWKYVPPRIGIFDGKTFHPSAPVTTVILHPPIGGGVHPKTAIRGDWHLAEIVTPFGTRTYGFADGYITPGLKFAVKLGPGQDRDEVIAKWKSAPAKP